MSTSKAKKDWLDEHLVIVGVSDKQADSIKNHVRAKLAPLPTLSQARELGYQAAVNGFGLDCNPWLRDPKAPSHKDAWSNGWDDFFEDQEPVQASLF